MNKKARARYRSIIGYSALTLGAIIIALSLLAFAQIEYAVSTMPVKAAKKQLHSVKNTPTVYTIKNDIKNNSQLFIDSNLHSKINITPQHFVFNEFLSHSGKQIVYAELSNCPDATGYSADCDWDYNIKIFDVSKKQTTTVYSQSGEHQSSAYLGDIIYYPVAWSKNDKKIILAWYNIGVGGQGFSPPAYSLLDASGGKITNPGAFVDCAATLFDSSNQVLAATNKNGGVACAEGDTTIPEQIIATNAETEKTTVIVEKEKGVGHGIQSFDPITKTLIYTTFPCNEGDQGCETREGTNFSTKQIQVTTR